MVVLHLIPNGQLVELEWPVASGSTNTLVSLLEVLLAEASTGFYTDAILTNPSSTIRAIRLQCLGKCPFPFVVA